MDHFTYKKEIDYSALQQGDVLKKTEELSEILKVVHPHFDSSNYNYFLVLTQSCDLVIRNGRTASKYITIAVIRPLEDAIKREAQGIFSSKLEKLTNRIIDEKNNSKLSETLTRLFNNNIHDYFYLHPSELIVEFSVPSVAFLRVSIALKSEMHYDVCLRSKILELEDNFKSKLGWLVGNLYSRVGTKDWVPADLTKFVKKQIESHFTIKPNIAEIEKELFKTHTEGELSSKNPDEIIEIIKSIKIQSKKDKVLKRIEEIVNEAGGLQANQDVKKLITKLNNDVTLSSYLR